VDLSPEFEPVQGAALVQAELEDPDRRIVEVSHARDGRYTLVADVPVMLTGA
jgi:hypothetical protein